MQGLLNQNTIQQILERRATCYYNIMCMNTMAESFTSAGSKTVNEEVINFFVWEKTQTSSGHNKNANVYLQTESKSKKIKTLYSQSCNKIQARSTRTVTESENLLALSPVSFTISDLTLQGEKCNLKHAANCKRFKF